MKFKRKMSKSKPLTYEAALEFAKQLSMLPGFPFMGATRPLSNEEANEEFGGCGPENITQFPLPDSAVGLACKLCTTGQGHFPPPYVYYSETDFLAHVNASHRRTEKLWTPRPGMFADATACAAGYLVTAADLDGGVDGPLQMLCLRCNVRFTATAFIDKRLCPVCKRQYRDYYTGMFGKRLTP